MVYERIIVSSYNYCYDLDSSIQYIRRRQSMKSWIKVLFAVLFISLFSVGCGGGGGGEATVVMTP
jgi:hypothetical protein